MTEYVRQVKIKLRDQYGFVPLDPEAAEPVFAPGIVPDGKYPMRIDGKLDNVMVVGGRFKLCNFK